MSFAEGTDRFSFRGC